jgi:uncharacterized protein YjaG (DUF416 family)
MLILKINELEKSEFAKQATFAYLTCERLYPNYIYFSNHFNFGNILILRKAIDYLYDNIFHSYDEKNKTNSLIVEIEKNTPDTEDWDTIHVSSALDSCAVIIEALGFFIDKKFNRIRNISTAAIDTVDMFVRNIIEGDKVHITDLTLQPKIDENPLKKKEVSIQSGIITFLNKRKSFDYYDVQTLLTLQENNNKGSLNL